MRADFEGKTATMNLTINDRDVAIDDAQIDPDMPLLWLLRDVLQMTGTKFGCGVAACGACTVQAPHAATPQPNLVPVICNTSRSTHSSGMRASACASSIVTLRSLIVRFIAGSDIEAGRHCRPPERRSATRAETAAARPLRVGQSSSTSV